MQRSHLFLRSWVMFWWDRILRSGVDLLNKLAGIKIVPGKLGKVNEQFLLITYFALSRLSQRMLMTLVCFASQEQNTA